jgi:hypothetical protein
MEYNEINLESNADATSSTFLGSVVENHSPISGQRELSVLHYSEKSNINTNR